MAGLPLFCDELQEPTTEHNGTYIKFTGQIQKAFGQVECRLCIIDRHLSSGIYSTVNHKPCGIRVGYKWVGYVEK